METQTLLLVTALIALVAVLYSSVGHAGGSGYLAVMALMGVSPAISRPSALVLNILVAMIASIKFYRAGHVSWSLLWPFAIASVPAAFIGGTLTVPSHVYNVLVGVILLYSAIHLFFSPRVLAEQGAGEVPLWIALIVGALIGLASGLIGVGGGIFLSPFLLFFGWAGARQAGGASAVFILVNSVAGLLGQLGGLTALPLVLPVWAVAAMAGGWLGATYGTTQLPTTALRHALALVLIIAGAKLILT